MILIGVLTALFAYFGDGPQWPYVSPGYEQCKANWWANLLYLNNIVRADDQVCYVFSVCIGSYPI